MLSYIAQWFTAVTGSLIQYTNLRFNFLLRRRDHRDMIISGVWKKGRLAAYPAG